MKKPINPKQIFKEDPGQLCRFITARRYCIFSFVVCCMLLCTGSFVKAQNGYIYLHKKSLDESSSVNFTFNLSGGSTSVGPVVLNDDSIALNTGDLGASHGGTTGSYGDGQLWATTVSAEGSGGTFGQEGIIYMRASGSAAWVSTGQTGYRLDGAGYNTLVYCNKAGNAYYYTYGGANSLIYSPANHGAATIRDIAYGGGITCIITSTGSILKYTGNYSSPTDSWTDITPSGALTSFYEIDIVPSSQTIYVQEGGGWSGSNSSRLYSMSATGANYTQVASPASSRYASYPGLCVDDEGVVYAVYYDPVNANDYQWDYDGTTWTRNIQSRSVHRATGGVGHIVWSINDIGYAYSTIFTRMTDGSRAWIDDERVRSAKNGNAVMIPVAAGTYSITEAAVAGWDLTNITICDPTNNSASSVAGRMATVNVAAGETVHVTFTDELLSAIIVQNDCAIPYVESFGSGSATFKSPIPGVTAYHYRALNQFNDGYYTLKKSNSGWFVSSGITADHTPDSIDGGNGYFLAVNASYSKDEFFRNRANSLIVGKSYTVEFWAADISPSMPIRPNITFGVASPGTNSFLSSVNTGDINYTYWRRYSFTFTATAISVDIVIRNNSIGGNGNDLVIDDIKFNITSPPVDAISGTYSACSNTGATYTYTNTTTGGVWSVSPASLASINSATGVLTPVANASGTATVSYFVKFPSGCVSTVSKDITIVNNCGSGPVSISGNVYRDAQGLRDNTVNGTAYTATGLYMVGYNNTTGKVQAVSSVASGYYNLSGLPSGNDYTLYLTAIPAVVGQTILPVVTLPLGWVNTGETVGTNAGSDGVEDGILPLGIVSVNTNKANFGVEQLPTANSVSVSGLWNPYNTNRVAVPTLTGSDPEDGIYNGTSGTNTVKILTLPDPAKGVLYYNGSAVAEGQIIASYTPSLLTIDPDDAAVSPAFTYSQIDSASKLSAPAIVTVGFAVILPVVFTDVSVTPENCEAAIRFTTQNEQNIAAFELLWSKDGTNWIPVARVQPKSNRQSNATQYKMNHSGAVKGNNYYRIKEVDADGKLTYSEIVKLVLNCDKQPALTIYPNPVKGVVHISGLKAGQIIQIAQPDGKLVLKQTATTDVAAIELSSQSAGLYIVQVCNAAGEVISRAKLVKE